MGLSTPLTSLEMQSAIPLVRWSRVGDNVAMVDEDSTDLRALYIEMGYPFWVAEALDGREVGPNALGIMSLEEVMDEVLTWHGIIGFTGQILESVKFLQEQGRQ
jgi:hypothetical protein